MQSTKKAFLALTISASIQPVFGNEAKSITAHEFSNIRCSKVGETVYFLGEGRVFLSKKGEGASHLFNFIGLDITTCITNRDGQVFVSSRELGYFTDKSTGLPLHKWTPPGDEMEIPVVHISNDAIQFPLPPEIPVVKKGKFSQITLELPAKFDNPVYGQERFSEYLPHPTIEYLTSYQFFFPTSSRGQINDSDVLLEYTEVGDPKPWMMPAGYESMTLRVTAEKISDFELLPEFLRKEIETRLPDYRTAPDCFLAYVPTNSYFDFISSIEAFEAGMQFPLAEREVKVCD